MSSPKYFPSLVIRQSEAEALQRLAEPIKDAIFPIVRVQAWPRPKNGEGGPVLRSMDHLSDAYGTRPIGLDIAPPAPPSDKTYKRKESAEWAALGRAEIASLRNPSNGFEAWCTFISSDPRRIPVVQWCDNIATLRAQIQQLLTLNRGLIFRFRQSQGWNLSQVAALAGISMGDHHILMVYDSEQIGLKEDLTVLGMNVQSAIITVNRVLSGGSRSHVLMGSSFPSEFASIGEEFACLAIRERQLHAMLRTSPPIITAGIDLQYGDYAAVFAYDRLPAFRGVPRVDYPTLGEWIYHRRREGFEAAAVRVKNDGRWDESNLCWGAQRIREAASGKMEGLNAPGKWTTVRMNIHMHVQAQSSGAPLTTDEPWID